MNVLQAKSLRMALLATCTAMTLLSGCAPIEPWVKPHERERFADPIMGSRGALADKHFEHVRVVREAAAGATGVSGGGCGCK